MDRQAAAGDGVATGGAPARKIASNRVFATYSSDDSICSPQLDAKLGLKVHLHSVSSHPKLAGKHLRKYLLVYPKPPRMKEFLGLLYQTRQPAECFGGRERRKNERRRAETRAAMYANLQLTANWRGYYTEGCGLARTNSGGL
jgi:hypothetical protein